MACFFLYSGESLSSGFCGCVTGAPGFRAEVLAVTGFALAGDAGLLLPLSSGDVAVVMRGNVETVAFKASSGDRLG